MKLQRFIHVVLLVSLCCIAGVTAAMAAAGGQEEAQPDWFFHDLVDADFVKQHISIPMDESVMIIDARPFKPKYIKGHIPMAVSIPNTHFDKLIDKLPANKDALLIFYCEGPKCKLSHKSAQKAMDMGYTNVKVYAAGYPAWKAATGDAGATAAVSQVKAGKEEGSIDIEYFKKMVAEQPDQLVLIDVRDADEFAKASLKTSTNIPIDNLEDKIKTLPDDKPIVFICGTGARSGEAFYMVQDVRPALKNVYYIEAEITFKKDGSFIIKKSAS